MGVKQKETPKKRETERQGERERGRRKYEMFNVVAACKDSLDRIFENLSPYPHTEDR